MVIYEVHIDGPKTVAWEDTPRIGRAIADEYEVAPISAVMRWCAEHLDGRFRVLRDDLGVIVLTESVETAHQLREVFTLSELHFHDIGNASLVHVRTMDELLTNSRV